MDTALSHHTRSAVTPDDTARLAARIEQRLRAADRLLLPLDEELQLLSELQEFDLGRFLLHNEGLNGYWTSYVFGHQPGDPVATELERWMLTRSLLPGIRERFGRFKAAIAPSVRDGAVLASVPCGLMDDLLQQDYRDTTGVRLIGVDIDPESVDLARENAAERGLAELCEFHVGDAWRLDLDAEADLLTSNGLNMYESDPERLVELYRNFARALRPGGRIAGQLHPRAPGTAVGRGHAAGRLGEVRDPGRRPAQGHGHLRRHPPGQVPQLHRRAGDPKPAVPGGPRRHRRLPEREGALPIAIAVRSN